MNSTIIKGIQELWEEADKKWKEQKEERKPDRFTTNRQFLVKDGVNPWGQPIEEIVDIVVDDIEGMPWSSDERDMVEEEIDNYFIELKEQARKKFFENYTDESI
jgi:hypothetical protein